jgi:CelD/BcsL family acetyltransferase involved in cellulose biosynthesis
MAGVAAMADAALGDRRVHGPLNFLLTRPASQPAPAASPPAPAADLAIEVLTSTAQFAALAPQWNRLHAEASAASVFNSWMWLYEWWSTYGAGRELRLLVAREGDQPVGLLPLYLERSALYGVPLRALRLVGIGGDTHPDDLGPVLARGAERHAAAALAHAALALPGADVWLFNDVDPASGFPAALEAAARALGLPLAEGAATRIALIELPRSWSQYMQALGRDARWRLRRSRRRLAEAGRTRFFVWDDPSRLEAALDRLAELHRARWAAAGGRSRAFGTPAYVAFHRSVIRSFFRRGWLRLYCLEVEGELAAMVYCYRFRNRIYLMQAGFDPKLARLGAGKVLLGYAIEHAIGEGNEAFDFLRGEHRYKDELATRHRETCNHAVFAATPAAFLYRLRQVWLPLLKARLQRRPPPGLSL